MIFKKKQPLPTGMSAFEGWSDRIIASAAIEATPESLKFVLADLLIRLGPQESHKEDDYFVQSLRKFAVNQIAEAKRKDIRDAAKARLAEEEAKRKADAEAMGN